MNAKHDSSTRISSDELAHWLTQVLPKQENLTRTVVSVLTSLMRDTGIEYLSISGRTKDKDSIVEKVKRKGYRNPSAQLTDITGIRIITFFGSQVKEASSLIRQVFEVDEVNSLDQSSKLGDDRIGYRSVHFVCKIGSQRSGLPEYAQFADLRFEVQVRTVLQHAWAELAHDRSYKFGQSLPTEIQRKLNLYAGTLELVDAGFDEISQAVDSYSREITQKTESDFLDEEVNSISLERFIQKTKFDHKVPRRFVASEFLKPSSIESELTKFGWTKIASLQRALTENFLSEYQKFVVSDTGIGFLRSLMMFQDPDKYFREIEPNWDAIDTETYNLLVDKYGAARIDNLLTERKIMVMDLSDFWSNENSA